MQLPKFILGDNSDFPNAIFVIHTEFPRFIINLEDDELEWFEDFDEEDEKELTAETETMIKLATEFYDREVPTQFAGDTGGVDTLMRSLITNYSLEGKTDGKPNHHFYLTKDAVKSVTKEVVSSHFGWKGKKGDAFVQK